MGTVAVVGTGLIGGSLGLALRRAGLRVQGYDADAARLARALERGAVDAAAGSLLEAYAGADVAFVAVTVSGVADAVTAALDAGVGAVSDVGSVKAPVVRAVEAQAGRAGARFVGGHPMAGSAGEEGIEGADADLFDGAAWVLTPTASTDPAAFTAVRDLVALTGAAVMAIDPDLHDELVATVSHLPHLAASALMHVAADAQPNHETLLRLAAGGFRALTRLSGRSAGIWPDICVENRTAIVDILDRYMKELERVRDLVAAAERAPLLDFFELARAEGSSLPARSAGFGPLVELSMPVPDRPGVLAEVTTLAGRHAVNIVDLDISHGPTGGVLVMVVPASGADPIVAGLDQLGYRTTRREVG
ncbi:MAG TPA: prephenate dehydrogenase/arogenate dehydrogenase family protein [Acidimicrobiia bacterium]|nr:prephenate dehydrogenase/arogenate dehydrogenase family protein [Acidimicrobiia bacterium]